jgi:adenylosuccinate synthase
MDGRHYIVCGLGFGDEGKGSVVDFLCSPHRPDRARTVIRFNGGAQAAHNELTADGRHHTFAQFGSGSFWPGVRTHLSRFVLVDPLALAAEAAHLATVGVQDALDRLTVDRDALLVTPYHQAANRARETARGRDRHGSCGMRIGETMRYALAWPGEAPRVADCASPRALARSLALLQDRLCDELGPLGGPPVDLLCDAYRAFAARVPLVDGGYLRRLLRAGPAVFEGAQGVLLDEWRGFHPYTTWSTTTFANAETLLAEAGETAVRLGVVRCYLTRHGPGPFVTEDPTLEFPEPHNGTGTWQGMFRTGHPDAVAMRYAAEVAGGVDAVALTHLDVAARHRLRVCRAYLADGQLVSRIEPGPEHDLSWQERLTRMLLRARPVSCDPAGGDPADWPGIFEDVLGAPVMLRSYGPTAAAKRGLQAGATAAAAGAGPD